MIWKSISGRYLRSLMMRFEAGPEDGPRCPDGGALKAYKCSAGKWTIAFGVRWHPDSRPVVEGDTITAEQVWEYTDAALVRVEADIRTVVTIEMNAHQYAGVVFWVYNLGIKTLLKSVEGESQLLPKINAGRWLDAASAMGVFVYTTTEKGGLPWKRAMFGLFIRRSAEGCTLLGFDWQDACDAERLALPTNTRLQPEWVDPETKQKGRYYDSVLEGKTPFLNIYRDAKEHPLELVLTPSMQAAPPLATTGSKEAVGAGPTPQPSPASAPVSPQVSPAPAPIVVPPARVEKQAPVIPAPSAKPAPAPVPAPAPKPASPPVVAGEDGTKPKSPWTVQPEDVHYKIDPGAGLKPLEDSDRAKAFYWQRTFMFIIYIGGTGVFGSSMLAGSELLMKHAALMSVVLDLAVPAAMALSALALGAVGKSWADWRRHCAQQRASQALY